MKRRILSGLCALIVCMGAVLSATVWPERVDIVYASEVDDQPDPFDYNLDCYTPKLNFGTISAGDLGAVKQFTVVNTGSNAFPLTWDEIDQYTAFDLTCLSDNLSFAPGEGIAFSVSPRDDVSSGSYSASYIFYSANDIRQNHSVKVTVSAVIKDDAPYITEVEIVPNNVSLPVGKNYTFSANVYGSDSASKSVTWSLYGNASASTTINQNGNLSVSSDETATVFNVIATSVQDPGVSDSAVVYIVKSDHVVSIKADPTVGGAVAGGGTVKDGSSVSIAASANNGYVFDGWYENQTLVSNANRLQLTNVTGDRNLVAKFTKNACQVKTSVNDANGGRVSSSTNVNYGGSVTITANANSGYSFDGFMENNTIISNAQSLQLNNITSDRNIMAVFSRNVFTVNIATNPNGVGKVEGAGKYNRGTRVDLKATPNSDYNFTGWTINGQIVSKDTVYTINGITGDVNITANFVKKDAKTYKFSSGVATDGGSIVPSGDYTAPENGSMTYTIVPQNGYKITSVFVDGKDVGALERYTFNGIKDNHTIYASFSRVTTPQTNQGTTSNKTQNTTQSTPQKKSSYDSSSAVDGAVPDSTPVSQSAIKVSNEKNDSYDDDVAVTAEEVQFVEPMDVIRDPNSIMVRHNLDSVSLMQMIRDDAATPLLLEAIDEGYLNVTVNNVFSENVQETVLDSLDAEPLVQNFSDAILGSLDEDEKYQVLTGDRISFNIDINNDTEYVSNELKSVMATRSNTNIVSFFNIDMMKTVDGMVTLVDRTYSPLEIKLPIPEGYHGNPNKLCVVRYHNGDVDVLENVGTDSGYVTFRTDKFSEYAIAEKKSTTNILPAIIAFIAGIALTCIIVFAVRKRSGR